MDFSKLREINDKKAQEAKERQKDTESKLANLDLQESIVKSFSTLMDYLDGNVSKTYIVNQLKEIKTPDSEKVVKAVEQLHSTLKTHKNTDLSEVTKVLKSILDEAKQLPKDYTIPEQKFVDYTDQLNKLTETVESLTKVVEAQELKVEAPNVNVEAPKIEVEAPDLEPLKKEITNVAKCVKGLVFPEYKTDNAKVEKLLTKTNKLLDELLDKPMGGGGGGSSWTAIDENGTPVPMQLQKDAVYTMDRPLASILDDTTTANTVYTCKAEPGSATSAAVWQIKRLNTTTGVTTWADGNANFDNIADDIATITYS